MRCGSGSALTGFAAAVLVAGWRRARWWRRGVTVMALPLSLLCAALALNLWVGYFPTVQTAWNQLTAGPLPDQTDQVTVTAMQQRATRFRQRALWCSVDISDAASGFRHRGELVYLPPAWYATNPPPQLPTVMMIGGEFNTPADWLRTGDAIKTIDDFAAAHRGNAPVLVFVDPGGAFNNDTECVNGSRGNAADHLTKDVVPYMVSNFGVSPDRGQLGHRRMVDGRHLRRRPRGDAPRHVQRIRGHRRRYRPELRHQGPDHRRGCSAATPTRGRRSTRRRSSPGTARTRGVAGWFDVNGSTATVQRAKNDQAAAANSLCALGAANGIDCAVVSQPGKHDWPFAAHAFAAALPWLAGQIGTPDVPPFPAANRAAADDRRLQQAAAR